MKPRWIMLAADLLEIAAEILSRRVCDDLEYPADWTEADKAEFGQAYEAWNSDGQDPSYPEAGMPFASMAMEFLAHQLREETDREDQDRLGVADPGHQLPPTAPSGQGQDRQPLVSAGNL